MKISRIPFTDLSFRLNTEFKVSRAEERDWVFEETESKKTQTPKSVSEKGRARQKVEGACLKSSLSDWRDGLEELEWESKTEIVRLGRHSTKRIWAACSLSFFFPFEQKCLSEAATTKYCATIPRIKRARDDASTLHHMLTRKIQLLLTFLIFWSLQTWHLY